MHLCKCKLFLSNGTITKESCNWFEFISVAQCQMTPLKVWLHTARGCNHQSFACPSYALMFGCSVTQYYDPEVRDESSGQLWDNDRASWSSSILPRNRTRASRAKDKSRTARPPLFACYLHFEFLFYSYYCFSLLLCYILNVCHW